MHAARDMHLFLKVLLEIFQPRGLHPENSKRLQARRLDKTIESSKAEQEKDGEQNKPVCGFFKIIIRVCLFPVFFIAFPLKYRCSVKLIKVIKITYDNNYLYFLISRQLLIIRISTNIFNRCELLSAINLLYNQFFPSFVFLETETEEEFRTELAELAKGNCSVCL